MKSAELVAKDIFILDMIDLAKIAYEIGENKSFSLALNDLSLEFYINRLPAERFWLKNGE